MVKGLIGRKIEMSQMFDQHGRVLPVTIIKVLPNYPVAIKQPEKDGYKAVQLGVGTSKKPTKPAAGHSKAAGIGFVPRVLREVAFDGEVKIGQEITIDQIFRKGVIVDIKGRSKGKGFAGVVKRWGFAGGPRTHGQSDRERAPGSIGATTTPGRVYKGLKMAGRMGNQTKTIQGLEVIEVKTDENELWIKGSIPGARGSLVLIEKSGKKKKAYQEQEIPAVPQMTQTKETAETSEEQEKEASAPESKEEEKEIKK